MSMKPGITVACARSTTSSPLPRALKPPSMPWMRSPSTTIVTRSRGAALTPSTRRPASISVAAEAMPGGQKRGQGRKSDCSAHRNSSRWTLVLFPGHGLDGEQFDVEEESGIGGITPLPAPRAP